MLANSKNIVKRNTLVLSLRVNVDFILNLLP